MATTKTPRGTATLLGIYKGEGHACDDCSRDLSARRFEVRTADGEVRILGRRCAAYATGYPTTRLEHEAAAKERMRAWRLEVATTWTVEQLADHYRAVTVVSREDLLQVWTPDGGTAYVPVAQAAAAELGRLQAEYAAGTL